MREEIFAPSEADRVVQTSQVFFPGDACDKLRGTPKVEVAAEVFPQMRRPVLSPNLRGEHKRIGEEVTHSWGNDGGARASDTRKY